MKLQLKLSLAFAGTVAVVALTGCPNLLPTSTTDPTSSPSPVTVASKLTGRLTFALGTNGSDPGAVLTVKLKKATSGITGFASYAATTSTDTAGNFSFSNLPDGNYQVWYDDEGKVASQAFNTTGLAVSDHVNVSATQSSVPSQNLELAWDFTSNIVPEPNTDVTAGQPTTFTWKAKNGFTTNTVYQVTVFMTSNTGSGAIISGPTQAANATNATTQQITIPTTLNSQSTLGTRYYVVKYWKKDGSFGNGVANYYGQTKPIPINVK